MTNEEIRAHVQRYTGPPFTISEYAQDLGITWHRMRRVVQSMLDEGELRFIPLGSGKFYEVTGHKQREQLHEFARRRAAWGEDFM